MRAKNKPKDFVRIQYKLRDMKTILLKDSKEKLRNQLDGVHHSDSAVDDADTSGNETIVGIELGKLGNNQQLIRKIDEALTKIDNGTYGICDECEEQIPIKRLNALPFATLCIPCQEEFEREEKKHNTYAF
jgi:DnaK suppressor protein